MTSRINEYKGLFSDNPTRTSLFEHDVDVGDAAPIKQHSYHVGLRNGQHLRNEVSYMLENDFIEPRNRNTRIMAYGRNVLITT